MDNSDSSKKYFDVAPPSAPIVQPRNRRMATAKKDAGPPEEYPLKTTDETANYDDTLIDQPEASEPSASSLSHPDLAVPDIDQSADSTDKPTPEESQGDNEEPGKEEPADLPGVNPLPGTMDESRAPSEEEEVQEDEAPEAVEADEEPEKQDQEPQELEHHPDNSEKKHSPIIEESDPEPKEAEEPADDSKIIPAEPFAATDALPDPGETAADEAKDDMQDPKIYDTKEYFVPIGNTHHKHGGLKMAFAFGILCAAAVVGAIFYYALKLNK